MRARATKVPLGGPTLLFLAGAVLETVVALVAFRAVVVEFLGEQGIDVSVDAPDPPPVRAIPPADPNAPPPVARPGAIQSIQSTLTTGLDELETICWANLGQPAEAGAVWTLQVTIEGDGSVSAVGVDDLNPALTACIDAEVHNWQFEPPGKSITVQKQVRFP